MTAIPGKRENLMGAMTIIPVTNSMESKCMLVVEVNNDWNRIIFFRGRRRKKKYGVAFTSTWLLYQEGVTSERGVIITNNRTRSMWFTLHIIWRRWVIALRQKPSSLNFLSDGFCNKECECRRELFVVCWQSTQQKNALSIHYWT
jgi:hypothetical protein